MPEQPMESRLVDNEALADMLSRALQDLPGIVRLEPTLKSTITHFRAVSVQGLHKVIKTEESLASTGRDGLHLTVTGGTVDLIVDIATAISRSAVATAEEAQQCAIRTIERAGLRAGTVNVTVLSIEGNTL